MKRSGDCADDDHCSGERRLAPRCVVEAASFSDTAISVNFRTIGCRWCCIRWPSLGCCCHFLLIGRSHGRYAVLPGPHKMLSSPPRAGARPSAWVSVKSAAFQEEANFPWRHTMEGALVVFVRLNDRPGLFDSLTSVWQMRTL